MQAGGDKGRKSPACLQLGVALFADTRACRGWLPVVMLVVMLLLVLLSLVLLLVVMLVLLLVALVLLVMVWVVLLLSSCSRPRARLRLRAGTEGGPADLLLPLLRRSKRGPPRGERCETKTESWSNAPRSCRSRSPFKRRRRNEDIKLCASLSALRGKHGESRACPCDRDREREEERGG